MTNLQIIRAGDAPHFELPGIEFTGLAAPSRGSSQLCTWVLTVSAGLDSPEPHTLDRDEVFMVTAGSLRLHPDTETLLSGDGAIAVAGTPIQLSNPGTEVAQVYVAVPAGFTAIAADGTPIGTPPWAQ